MRGDRDGTAGFLMAGQRRGVFEVDEDRALAELELAWADGGYHGFSADGGTCLAAHRSRSRREDRPGPAAARISGNHLGHVRSPVADKDESTKAVIDAVVDSKFQGPADSVRTEGGAP